MQAQRIGIEVELAVFRLRHPVVCSFLPYTKEAPMEQAGTLYHKDASMFEIAMRPCANGMELDAAYIEALNQAYGMLPAGAEFELLPAVEYSSDELATDEYASVLGCGTSMNIYKGYIDMPNKYPDNTRYAGMHVNIQADDYMQDLSILTLDATLGLKSVRDWEQPWRESIQARRTMYGLAGEHRRKDFGLEYRTLPASSWGQTSGDELFSLVNTALSLDPYQLTPLADQIEYAINSCNAQEADSLLQQIHSGAI